MSDNPITRLEGYRFGEEGGADPADAARKASPWSIRNSLRRFGMMTTEELKEAYQDPRRTQHELIAIKKILTALKGDVRAMDKIEESVDGKLVETKVEVRTDSYAALVREAAEMAKARKNGQ